MTNKKQTNSKANLENLPYISLHMHPPSALQSQERHNLSPLNPSSPDTLICHGLQELPPLFREREVVISKLFEEKLI